MARSRDAEQDGGPGGWAFWTGLVLGWAVMAYAVRGIVVDEAATSPPDLARWLVGSALVHDVLLAPVVTAAGLVLAAVLPSRVRGPVVAATAISGIVALVALPLVLRLGERPDDPSALPLDYGTNLVGVLVGVWTVAAAVVGWRWWRGRRPAELDDSPGG